MSDIPKPKKRIAPTILISESGGKKSVTMLTPQQQLGSNIMEMINKGEKVNASIVRKRIEELQKENNKLFENYIAPMCTRHAKINKVHNNNREQC